MSSKMIAFLLIVSLALRGKGLALLDSPSNTANDKSSAKSLSFSWSDCGSANDPIRVQKLSLLPDPLDIPGKISLGTDFTANATESSPLALSITVQKKLAFIWWTIPCEHNLGSCDYPDVCQLVTKFKCPQAFKQYGIPCQCPLPKGVYHLPTSEVLEIDKSILPVWLESGHYWVNAHLKDKSGNEVLCIQMTIMVGSNGESNDFIDYIDNNLI